MDKKLVYTIKAKVEFDPTEVNINDVLETLRSIGEAEIEDVEVVEATEKSGKALASKLRNRLNEESET